MSSYNLTSMQKKLQHPELGSLRTIVSCLLITCLSLISACGGSGDGATNVSTNVPPMASNLPPLPSGPISYVNAPPMGKLPYPQHNPQFSSAQYEQMRKTNWVLNNFSMYQGSDDGITSMYLHDGLDFMLPDATPVYAVRTGTIRDISGDIVTVDNPSQPDTGWQMAHLVVDPRLKIGEQIFQGQYLGTILTGNAHTHFNLLRRADSGSWFRATKSMYPNDLFELTDTMPPEFNSDIRYFKNASDIPFTANEGVSGKVDIVVAMRDLSPNHPSNYGTRSAPANFEVTIADVQGKIKWRQQSDFRKLMLTPPFLGDTSSAKQEANLLFKKPNLMENGSWTQKSYLWWIVSNLPDHQTQQSITAKDEDLYWDSAMKDQFGQAIFPNNHYIIKITVIDHNGNKASIENKIRVNN